MTKNILGYMPANDITCNNLHNRDHHLAKSKSGNHLFYANNDEVKYIDCSNVKLPYFSNLINDVKNRKKINS